MPGPAKLNDNLNIPFAELNLSQLFYVAHPLTGIGGKNTLQALRDLIASTLPSGGGLAPITLYPTVVEMLANETLQPNHFALVINEPMGEGGEDDPTEWLLYVYMGGARDSLDSYLLIARENQTGGEALVISPSLSRNMAAGSAIEIFTGSNDGVWTFPPISGNIETKKVIKNKTSAFNLTIDSSGSDEIWDFEEADSRVIGPGESRTYINDGTHWTQI